MKNILFGLIAFLICSSIWAATEYRTFVGTDGKVLRGRILSYNRNSRKVTIEREDKRSFQVPITVFSEEDQAYIQKWQPGGIQPDRTNKEKDTGFVTLSKDEVENIAKQYADACVAENYASWKILFHDVESVSASDFRTALASQGFGVVMGGYSIEKIRVKKIEGLNVHITIQCRASSANYDGWLQLLPNGKIKYDPIVHLHPIPKAIRALPHSWSKPLDSNSLTATVHEVAARNLTESGIPLFGLELDSERKERRESVEKIHEWLKENGDSWDNSEPKIPCHEDQFKKMMREYKDLIGGWNWTY